MAWVALLVSVCFVGAGSVLGQSPCEFTELKQGLNMTSWDAGANYLVHLPNMSDERECQRACCMKEDCQLALIVTAADGSPQCFVVNCLKDGENVCVLEPSEHSKVYLKPQISELSNSSTDSCRFEKVVGYCRAAFHRFYYDVTEQTCKTFVYGGCGGNANNFKTKDECEATCSGVTGDAITDTSSIPKFRQPLPQDLTAESSEALLPEMTSEEFAVKCQAEAQVGVCRASIPRYYYSDGTCKRFRYGGCGGNGNNYNTEEECMKTCTVKIVDSKKSPDVDDVEYQAACLVPSDSGPCRAAFLMYYFEPKTQSCKVFIYGGCKGNKNRYSTLEECMSKCAGQDGDAITDTSSIPKFRQPLPQDLTAESSEALLPEMTSEEFAVKCQAEVQVGVCRASIPRYYYSDGTCKRFRYGGCGGNGNNYNTEEECMKTCTVKIVDSKKSPDVDDVEYQAACLVPSDSGPCRAAFLMYYFEPKTQSCKVFIYGGCKGNKNRYSTLEECMSKCAGQDGGFEEHGFHKAHSTPAFFLVSALTIMSLVLLVGLFLVGMRRVKHQRLLLLDDKQELLPEEHLPVEDVHTGVIS